MRDPRTTAQRYADVFMDLIRPAHASGKGEFRAGEPPRITIIAHADDGSAQFGTGEPVKPGLLDRFSCDATLQTVLLSPGGKIADVGRKAPTVTPAQRRALAARFQGCVIPGCTAPAA
jgi:hypothetical protein